ncbi:MAG: flagellar basal body rod protein [Asticcacaulis sp.]
MTAIATAMNGVIAANARFDKAAVQTARDASESKDLLTDFVEQKEARIQFEANISVVETADAMTGRLLNIRA